MLFSANTNELAQSKNESNLYSWTTEVWRYKYLRTKCCIEKAAKNQIADITSSKPGYEPLVLTLKSSFHDETITSDDKILAILL